MSLKTLQQWELKCEDHRCECKGCHVLKQIHFHTSKRIYISTSENQQSKTYPVNQHQDI